MRSSTSLSMVVGVFVLCASPVFAQYTTASFSGTVVDSNNAVLPESQVIVRNVGTGFTQSATTDQSGAFLFPRLPVGSYELRVERPGFSTYVQTGITLTVDQAASRTVVMQVGQVTEEVTVEADAELITSRSGTLSQLVDQKRVVELPLNGRMAQSLVFLAAGTVDLGRNGCRICGHGGVYPGEQTAGVNGAGMAQVNYQLDGAGHNDTYLNVNVPFPNPDAVQEFNLQSSNFTAEYGNAAGGIVNIVTRSGTNEIRGSLFEFFRDGSLNARNFFAPAQDTLKRNQFGGSVGGPILKDKMFYFGTYQGTRIRSEAAGQSRVRSDGSRARRGLLVVCRTARGPRHAATVPEQSDSAGADQPGGEVFPGTDPAAEPRRPRTELPRHRTGRDGKSVHDQGGVQPPRAPDQRPLLLYRLRPSGRSPGGQHPRGRKRRQRGPRAERCGQPHLFNPADGAVDQHVRIQPAARRVAVERTVQLSGCRRSHRLCGSVGVAGAPGDRHERDRRVQHQHESSRRLRSRGFHHPRKPDHPSRPARAAPRRRSGAPVQPHHQHVPHGRQFHLQRPVVGRRAGGLPSGPRVDVRSGRWRVQGPQGHALGLLRPGQLARQPGADLEPGCSLGSVSAVLRSRGPRGLFPARREVTSGIRRRPPECCTEATITIPGARSAGPKPTSGTSPRGSGSRTACRRTAGPFSVGDSATSTHRSRRARSTRLRTSRRSPRDSPSTACRSRIRSAALACRTRFRTSTGRACREPKPPS